ncbi:unnamed protein product [Arctia plantaginis]|uniref:Uncharacterized protein n=1 Tax=Arctia plantaginis TaxID=874455 RepID=A0A8S1A4F8_ARCPL|nr:unnamed protein product [Arctia plantaginis]
MHNRQRSIEQGSADFIFIIGLVIIVDLRHSRSNYSVFLVSTRINYSRWRSTRPSPTRRMRNGLDMSSLYPVLS